MMCEEGCGLVSCRCVLGVGSCGGAELWGAWCAVELWWLGWCGLWGLLGL